ncbi:hypothetical protein [Microbacterium plantarum]|uniref:Uncharacterized protein n=1 Tax=Microbacterium plantarum TaxID=1816425 RepID=A0ABV5EST6_9MICO
MEATPLVRVRIIDNSRPPRVTTIIEGGADERLLAVLERTRGPAPESHRYQIALEHPEGGTAWACVIDPITTLLQAFEFANGDELYIDAEGRGGGALISLWELINAGLTYQSLWTVARSGFKHLTGRAYRSHRRAVADWVDDGLPVPPPMELVQFVCAEAEWERRVFDEVFGLQGDRRTGADLLRAVGYEKVLTQPERWADRRER